MNFDRLQKIYNEKGYNILDIKPWQFLQIYEKVWEWNNQRIWKFKWLVIKVKKTSHIDWSFTIRGKTAWNTIEKIYPLSFPKFEKIELVDEYKVRRSKLYYIREKIWKDAKMKSKISAERRWSLLTGAAVSVATENVEENQNSQE